jgi:glycosyltransferase involved in cell wall biosynthesis
MKVLFVSSGNTKDGKPIINIQNQAKSLLEHGVSVVEFCIHGKGISGYLNNIIPLYKVVRREKPDVVHAHYSLSAYLATISLIMYRSMSLFGACGERIPLVVSLMGSDLQLSSSIRPLLRFFCKYFWSAVIVKSKYMNDLLDFQNANVIPNGVDLERVKPQLPASITQSILFCADPSRFSKNYELAKSAYSLLPEEVKAKHPFELVYGVSHTELVKALNEAGVMLLTSRYEGASIVVKEAMACNCPIVSTDVGDIRWVFGTTKGCFITAQNPIDIRDKLVNAIAFAEEQGRTEGRERLRELGLDSANVAIRIVKVYERTLQKKIF